MKYLSIILSCSFMTVSCSEQADVDYKDTQAQEDVLENAASWSKAQNRNGLIFLPNQEEPYSGWAKDAYGNGQARIAAKFENGLLTKFKRWRENGIPSIEANYVGREMSSGFLEESPDFSKLVSSELDGDVTGWHENGEKAVEAVSANGKLIRVTRFDDNGQKRLECTESHDQRQRVLVLTEWHENGQVGLIAEIVDFRISQAKRWRQDGTLYDLNSFLTDSSPGPPQARPSVAILEHAKLFTSPAFWPDLTTGPPIDHEVPSGEPIHYEIKDLITNLGGPVKSRYIDVELKLEGVASDFAKILQENDHRLRDKALKVLGSYTYEDAQLDGFQERVRIDLKKGFSSVLRKYRDGDSDLIRQIYFTQFVIQ